MSFDDLATATYVMQPVPVVVTEVEVVAGPDEGTRRSFDRTVTIGKGAAAGLRLTDRQVSRLHCEISAEGEGPRVRDLGSKNGTWLGSHRVCDAWLGAGARLRVGATMLEVRVEQRQVTGARWTGPDRFGELLGADPDMHRLFALMARVAPTPSRVVIEGESGTGKELVARALHAASDRRQGPFVVVDGATLSSSLADLELFGHVRGAFTGADVARAGAFERANGGTLFLDELGEIPLAIQPKLLRALEDGTVQRVGDEARTTVDVRVVAATNRRLSRMLADGTFREDLYHRLAEIQLAVPPLRERPGDVPRIARAMLSRLAPGDVAAADALEVALGEHAGYRWPGNVRELRAMVRRVVALGEAGPRVVVDPDDWSDALLMNEPFAEAKRRAAGNFERRYLKRLLAETGGKVTEAAERAGMNRSHLSTLITKLGLRS